MFGYSISQYLTTHDALFLEHFFCRHPSRVFCRGTKRTVHWHGGDLGETAIPYEPLSVHCVVSVVDGWKSSFSNANLFSYTISRHRLVGKLEIEPDSTTSKCLPVFTSMTLCSPLHLLSSVHSHFCVSFALTRITFASSWNWPADAVQSLRSLKLQNLRSLPLQISTIVYLLHWLRT